MATKKTKSRTAQSALTKKHHFPLWSIVVVVLLVAGIGVYFVYNSYASSPLSSSYGNPIWRNGSRAVKYSNGTVIANNSDPKICVIAHSETGTKFTYQVRLETSTSTNTVVNVSTPTNSVNRCYRRANGINGGKRYKVYFTPAGNYAVMRLSYAILNF